MILHITLPLLPTLNHAYKNAYGKTSGGKAFTRRVLTDDAQTAMATAGIIARNAARLAGWAAPDGARFALTLRFYFARDTRDGDNAIKLTQDALAQALGFNDKAIKEWHVYSAVDKASPRCEVELCVIDAQPQRRAA